MAYFFPGGNGLMERREQRNGNSLLVEEEGIVAMHIGKELKRVGYRVEITQNPAEAIEKIKQNDYELIIFSEMRGLNGREFYNKVVEFDKDLAKKIIFILSWRTDDTVLSGNLFLVKPFFNEELVKTVKGLSTCF
jgi:two-component SAPR family response regulator